jgi:hypothetical protein
MMKPLGRRQRLGECVPLSTRACLVGPKVETETSLCPGLHDLVTIHRGMKHSEFHPPRHGECCELNVSLGPVLPIWFGVRVESFWLTEGYRVRYAQKQGKRVFFDNGKTALSSSCLWTDHPGSFPCQRDFTETGSWANDP